MCHADGWIATIALTAPSLLGQGKNLQELNIKQGLVRVGWIPKLKNIISDSESEYYFRPKINQYLYGYPAILLYMGLLMPAQSLTFIFPFTLW